MRNRRALLKYIARCFCAAAFAIVGLTLPARANDAIKIGIAKNSVSAPFFVAESRGYFAAKKLAWYKSQGMIKPDVNAEATIDKRYVVCRWRSEPID